MKLPVHVFKECLRSNMAARVVWFYLKKAFNWKKSRDRTYCVQKSPMCSLCVFPISTKLSSLHSFLHYFHHDYVTPLLHVISPGLEKQSIQSRLREEGRGKKERDLSGNLSRSCWALREKRRRSNLEGRRIFPSQVIHLCLQNSFRDQSYCAFVVL